MAINSSISDIPWLGQPADLATSLLKGSQVGESLVSAYLRARELREREEREKALLPLRQQEMQARVANQALELKINQDKMALALKMKAADAAGWEALSKVDNILDPAQVGPIYAEGAKAGGYSPSFTSFLENIQQNAQMTNVRALEAAARMRTESKPTAVVQTVQEATRMEQEALRAEAADDPILARRLRKDAVLLRESVRGAPAPTETSGVKNAKARLEALKARLSASGDHPLTPAQEAAQYEQFVAEQTAQPNEETVIETGPTGITHITTRRGGKQGPTVGSETKAQTDLQRMQGAVQQLDNMVAQIRPGDLGIAGKVTDFANKWLRQISPEIGDISVSANRAQAEGAVNAFLDVQVARGRIRKDEVARLRIAFLDPQALGQQYDQFVTVGQQMKKLTQMESISIAKNAKQPLESWMMIGLGIPEFQSLRKAGTLTAQEALDWYKKINAAQ